MEEERGTERGRRRGESFWAASSRVLSVLVAGVGEARPVAWTEEQAVCCAAGGTQEARRGDAATRGPGGAGGAWSRVGARRGAQPGTSDPATCARGGYVSG